MKNQIRVYLFLLLFTVFKVLGQECGTEVLSKEKVREIENIASTIQDGSTSEIEYLPVKLHLTKNGSQTNYYLDSQFMYEFSRLNKAFLPLGFQFYLADTINYIDDSRIDYINTSSSSSYLLVVDEHNVDNAINLYYVNDSNIGGRSNFPSGDRADNWMYVKNGNFEKGETLIHEMGHYFNLYHTFETYFAAELVDGSNCTTAGDFVCDTPADSRPTSYDKLSCVYTGTATDANSDTYSPSMTNHMSYYNGGCVKDFTLDQITRAQAGHQARLSLIASEGNQYDFSYPSIDTITISNLRAFELNTQLKLRWQAHATPLGFLIERSTSPSSGFETIGGVLGNAREFSDPTYEVGQTYYYRVKAVHSKTNYSNTANITPTKPAFTYGEVYASYLAMQWLRFRDVNNYGAIIYAPRDVDEINDLAANYRSVTLGRKYRFWWDTWENYPSYFKVWVDLNQNHVFESNEIIVSGNGEYGSDSLEFPTTIKSGYYRMRFRSNFYEGSFSATEKLLFGSTFDFLLFLNGECPENFPVFGTLNKSFVSASQSIETYDYTNLYLEPVAGIPVTLSSPSITLKPGFSADGFNTFLAEPGGCP